MNKTAWGVAAVAAALIGGTLFPQVSAFAAASSNTQSVAAVESAGGAEVGPNVQHQAGSQVNDGQPDSGSNR